MNKNIAFAALVLLLAFGPLPARAQLCETPSTAENRIDKYGEDVVDALNDFVEQEKNFAANKLTELAQPELVPRFEQFDEHVTAALSEFNARFLPALQKMAEQLHLPRVTQLLQLGRMQDAAMIHEYDLTMRNQRVQAHRRYRPSEQACQADTLALAQARAMAASQAYTKGMSVQSSDRRMNKKGSKTVGGADSKAAIGPAAELELDWQEYVTYFCDPKRGDQGCAQAGTLPGRHTTLGALLFGPKQSIDMSNANEQRVVRAAQKYVVFPRIDNPIPKEVVDSKVSGRSTVLARRSRDARIKTIDNVIGQLVAERIGGSGVNAQGIRTKAGVSPQNAATNASYREIQLMQLRDRYLDPEYLDQVVSDPSQVNRGIVSIGGTRLQQLFDLSRRLEEMVFMEAAVFAAELDQRRPPTGVRFLPR